MGLTLFADGFDDAIMGVDLNSEVPRVVYSVEKMVFILMHRDDMSEDEALEYLDFNVFQAYLGEGTPIYMNQMSSDEIREILWP
jgi:hypothetical protein